MRIQLGSYFLDTLRHVLLGPGDIEAQLSPLASQLLQELAKKPGHIFERSELIAALWRGDWRVGDPGLNRVVSELRKAVGDDRRAPSLIQTVPRRGYRLVSDALMAPSDGAAVDRDIDRLERIWRLAALSIVIVVAAFVLIVGVAVLARNLR